MCDTGNRADVTPAEALPASLEWKGEVLPLEPVDELSVLTVCDNVTDILLPDQGPAKRLPLAAMGRLAPLLAAPTIVGGKAADVPLAQHGFSALVEIRKGSRVRRLLFGLPVASNVKPTICPGVLLRGWPWLRESRALLTGPTQRGSVRGGARLAAAPGTASTGRP